MKRLDLRREPRWVKIDEELSLLARPLSRSECTGILAPWIEPITVAEKSAAAGDIVGQLGGITASVGLAADLVMAAVTDWTVLDAETDGRMAVTREAVEALIDAEPALAEAMIDALLGPTIHREEALRQEGNASRPSPNGTTAAATPIAPPAPARARNARRG